MTLALINLSCATLSFGYALKVALSSPRPQVRRMAGRTAVLSFLYVLIFSFRLYNGGERAPGWVGEVGSALAPIAFLTIWFWHLYIVDVYVRRETEELIATVEEF